MPSALVQRLTALTPAVADDTLLTRGRRRFREPSLRALVQLIDHYTRSNAARALELAEMGLTSARQIGDPAHEARFQRSQGHALRALNRYPDALASYDAALRTYRERGDSREAAITQIGRIDSLMYLGQYDTALRAARSARRIFLRDRDTQRVARLDTNTGNLFHRLDRPAIALRHYNRSRRAFTRLRDVGALGLVELNRGNVLSTLGRIADARTAYHQARKALTQASMPALVLQTDYSLAYLDFLDHRLPEALDRFERVRPLLEAHGERRTAALCRLDTSEIYLRLNLWHEARVEAEQAVDAFGDLNMAYEQAKAMAFGGAAEYQLGRTAAASALWKRSLQLFRSEGNDVWCGQLCQHLAQAALRSGRAGVAERLGREALACMHGPGLAERRGFVYLTLAAARLRQRDRPGASRALRQAQREARWARSPWLRHEVLYALGAASEARGDCQAALMHFTAAAREGERLRALLESDDFRAAFHRDKTTPYFALAALELERGRPGRAFAQLERGRARGILDLLARMDRRRGTITSASVRRRLQRAEALFRKIGLMYRQDGEIQESGKRGLHASMAASRVLAREESAAVGLLGSLNRLGGEQTLPRGDHREVRAALSPDEALFEYFIFRGRVGAFVLTRESISVSPNLMPESALKTVVRSLRFQWGRFHIGASYLQPHQETLLHEAWEDLRTLRRRLWDPLVDAAPRARTVIVVPFGDMASLPWAALGGDDPVASTWGLVLSPSAEVFLRCRTSQRSPGRGSVLFDSGDEGIPEAAREVAAIAGLLPGSRRFSGAAATVSAFQTHTPAARIVHVAAHGLFHKDRPVLSGIQMADRWMSVYDVQMTPLRAELVALSACGTARSEVWPGEEWMGLVRAFLAAGARRVLAALWEVDDASTRKLMERFYAYWLGGASASNALRRAQVDMSQRNPHPYGWAGFTLVGVP